MNGTGDAPLSPALPTPSLQGEISPKSSRFEPLNPKRRVRGPGLHLVGPVPSPGVPRSVRFMGIEKCECPALAGD